MLSIIGRILAKRDLRKFKEGKKTTGDKVWIYFKNVKKAFRMRISSIRLDGITARFESEEDETKSKIAEDYNQFLDNDIKFNNDFEPTRF